MSIKQRRGDKTIIAVYLKGDIYSSTISDTKIMSRSELKSFLVDSETNSVRGRGEWMINSIFLLQKNSKHVPDLAITFCWRLHTTVCLLFGNICTQIIITHAVAAKWNWNTGYLPQMQAKKLHFPPHRIWLWFSSKHLQLRNLNKVLRFLNYSY